MSKLLQFSEISKSGVDQVGGKGGSLGEMTQAGIPVPPGFVITTEVYQQYHSACDIPDTLQTDILQKFDELKLDRVAVRSSAIAEDSADTSWAGQFETILNVGRDNLIDAIYECWRSASSDIVKGYAEHNQVSEDKLALAVVVQQMIASDVAGVAFCKNPVTGDEHEIMIEACWGLGEMLVQGMVTPDNYIINKTDLSIKARQVSTQDKKLVSTESGTAEVDVDADEKGEQKLSDDKIKELSELVMKIEQHYGSPQDIEWALANDKLYILQSRPITA